ncbi:DNA polymerase III subunit chi [Ideonella sp. A 288]|uniref:DNA polymerase III subunit chi n=1 Tax=Ideonella sp. A 288 TaxID=1962181 RepID=UPI000B4B1FCD|nr:DNA polymerase III subunit chi [Ideonella sp. A 288]
MTDVAFHTGIPDKPLYTCRLLRKAWRSGARLVVVGTPEALSRLDQALWVFEQEEFVPHLRMRHGELPTAEMRRTPIWLADSAEVPADAGVLVNLGPDFVEAFERFERVIEVVAADEQEALAARQRWRRYSACGSTPSNMPYRQEAGGRAG